MRQSSCLTLVILFNILLIHSTVCAPLTTSTTNGIINQNDFEATNADVTTASVTSSEISHVVSRVLDNIKEINDKTGTLSNNNNINDDNKKNVNEYDDVAVNEIKDENYEKDVLSDKGSRTTKNNELNEVISSTISDQTSSTEVVDATTNKLLEITSVPTTIENISEKPYIVPTLNNRSENIPLIIFETQNKSDPETYIDVVSDKDTTIEITLTSDEDAPNAETSPIDEKFDYESPFLSTLYTTRVPPPSALVEINNNNKEDEIKIKTTDKDSDTVFLISNTEVKMIESNPTPFPPINSDSGPNFNPVSSIEDVVIDFAYNTSSLNLMNNIEPDIVLSSLNTYENEYTRENIPLIRAPDSSYQESFSINFQEQQQPSYVSRLVKESLNIHINTPTNISIPNNLTRDSDTSDLVLKNLSMPFEQFGGNTTIFLDADANSIFSGLDDFQTVVVACLLTLIPLILLAVLAVAIRCIWQKYHRDYDTGSVLLGEYNSECQQNAKPNDSITVDIQKNNAVTVSDDATNVTVNSKPNSIIATNNTQQTTVVGTDDSSNKCPNNCTSRNGSIIKMTMQNNHLIVETEERNDISRDARETKLSYTSPDKDGIFIVAATRGADQLESLKTNNILKAKQDEKCEFHDRCIEESKKNDNDNVKEEVQIHSPPDLIQPLDKVESSPIVSPVVAKTGLTQSDTSLNSSSDSNQNYSYGTQVVYRNKKPSDLTKRSNRSIVINGTTSNSQLNGNLSSLPNCNYNNNNNNYIDETSNDIQDTNLLNTKKNDSTSSNSKVTESTAPPPPLPDVVV